MRTSSAPLWTQPAFRKIAGPTWHPGGEGLTRHGLGLCAFAKGARVLDVGCGAGAALAMLKEHGCVALGVDSTITPADGHGAHPPVICADAAHLPFADAAFDGLVMECVLSLMDDPADVLRQCVRVLRPGARMLLTDMVAENAARQAGSSCHERALSRAGMDTLFARAGLTARIFEDHTAHLRELAAKLVWYGQASRRSLCACGSGYGLWVLEKGERA